MSSAGRQPVSPRRHEDHLTLDLLLKAALKKM